MTEAKDKPTDNRVQFRLSDVAALDELDKRAEAQEVSRNQVAQDLLTAILRDDFKLQVHADVESLRDEVRGLRRDIEEVLFLILLNFEVPEDAGDEEQDAHETRIRQLVRRALRR